MNDLLLELQERDVDGKKVAQLRKENLIPSIVYGGQSVPIMTQSPIVETTKLAKAAGKHTPINIVIGGKKKLAIIKTIDVDPIKHSIRHLAFHTIKQSDVITAEVPIVLIGEGDSIAEKAGLVVLQAIEQIEVKAKPADLPESIELSIINLATDDDKLTVADIKLPKGVEFADVDQDMELAIASVYEPSALQAANDSAGGDEDAAVEDVEVATEGATESEASK
ncbi:50S ribosomal protein L25 [Candidatus Saccharibacteria bacterium HGW-Saccharibacteria-1]|jgi:large subunit ribosomal protein L25|nr:MAG: 50S ribosomal protein L25 [Candidatus Saccharibacteria bacterium HGW-Saccharibacteria-1]